MLSISLFHWPFFTAKHKDYGSAWFSLCSTSNKHAHKYVSLHGTKYNMTLLPWLTNDSTYHVLLPAGPISRNQCALLIINNASQTTTLSLLINHYYLLGTWESYGPTAQHMRKIVQSSLDSWTTYIHNKLEASTLCKFLSYKVAYYRDSYSLYFSHFVKVTFWLQLKIGLFSQLYLTSYNFIIGKNWLVFSGVLLGIFFRVF